MAQISRSTKISGGTTLTANTTARAADVETDVLTLFNAHNNHDTGSSTWTTVQATGSSTVPLIVNNSTGTQNIANFQDNGTNVLTVADGGTVTIAPAGTTKVVANSSGLTLSNSATIAMGSAKITGLAAASANGDAVRFEQIFYGFQAAVQTTSATTSSTTSNSYQTTNLTVNITPTSSSHRIRISWTTQIRSDSTVERVIASIFRDSTDLDGGGNGFADWSPPAANETACFSGTWIDSPATTSQVTYSVRIKNTDNAASVAAICGLRSAISVEEIV